VKETLFTTVFIGILPNCDSADVPPYINGKKIRLVSYFCFDSDTSLVLKISEMLITDFVSFFFLFLLSNLVNVVVGNLADVWVRSVSGADKL